MTARNEQERREAPSQALLGYDQMFQLFVNGIIGTKEFRNWLAARDDYFLSVRDADIDNEIDRKARIRSELYRDEDIRREAMQDLGIVEGLSDGRE
jgi:hypothetical protein